MKRFIAMIAVVLAALTGGMASNARGIDPQADSIAIMQMRQRMAEIRFLALCFIYFLLGEGYCV